ncbi:MAG TPA: aldo/keto reductase [Chitinophagaceae bacterium]|jgi:diketogulonate reductase-like aldo/keto reductase|nr:aldo/keto reductase [Chitinophagaceae bacterium]
MVNSLDQQSTTTLNNGVEMPLLGLGVYNMYGKTAEQAVGKALEIGYRLIDTATLYENEKEVGNAIRKSLVPRKELFVTTKVANSDQGYDATLKAFDSSLKKLGLDYVDLYLVHWPIKGKRKQTWMALEKLYADKKVRAIGVANYLIPFLDELNTYATTPPAVNQVEFSPYLYLEDLLLYCKKFSIQLQAYSPLVRGRKLQDPRLLDLAKKYSKTPAQIILRWNIEHGVSPIPKSSNPARLLENAGIFDFKISPEDIAFIDNFHENFRVVDDPMTML